MVNNLLHTRYIRVMVHVFNNSIIVFLSQMNSALEQLERSVSEMIALYAGQEGR